MQPVKNKKLTYLLICAVAAVWGIVIYRLFFAEVAEDYQPAFAERKMVHEPYDQYAELPDTFKLALNYRDPFLGALAKSPTTVTAPVKPAVQVIPLPVKPLPPVINWAAIQYTGSITNPVTKKIVSIVTVNGRERMLGEGEVFEGLKLIKNKRDSILVLWQGKQKYIKQ
ncbi:hypothetical protein LPB86_03890 [Pedobacter sp. MC2016-14]|uniref:hypothetical protein n=1 Tax=Pedobacter sp. MC2016-14 TaxID=2897327 RepID=UPI001E2E665B|nr:hypothetical protein [Pedobacter sp. MC2016-14]MCD0487356.1 hypothetical protein [Pedobacter sp. MC2016-14]